MNSDLDQVSDDEEEVRCICPNCFGEGRTMVSKARANELKTLKEISKSLALKE